MEKIVPHKKVTLKEKMLKALRMSRGFEEFQNCQEEIVHVGIPANNYYNYRKEIETALLEAEHKKAKAMEWQRRRFIC